VRREHSHYSHWAAEAGRAANEKSFCLLGTLTAITLISGGAGRARPYSRKVVVRKNGLEDGGEGVVGEPLRFSLGTFETCRS